MDKLELERALRESLPYFESEDKDEYLYIVSAIDIPKVVASLHDKLFSQHQDSADVVETQFCQWCGATGGNPHKPNCKTILHG